MRSRFSWFPTVVCGLIALVPVPVAAQTSGNITFDPAVFAYFVTGDGSVFGDIYDNDVFVGKSDAAVFETISPPLTLTISGASDGSSGANVTGHGGIYPDGNAYYGLHLFGNNTVAMDGGSVQFAYAYDAGNLGITGGLLSTITIQKQSILQMSGGSVSQVTGNQSALLQFSGSAVVGDVYANENTTVAINGNATVGSLNAYEAATLSVNGPAAKIGKIATGGTTTLDIAGGSIGGSDPFFPALTAYGQTGTTISGGEIAGMELADAAIAEITGGNVTNGQLSGFSRLTASAGLIGDWYLYGQSQLALAGTDLQAALLGTWEFGTVYSVTGFWADVASTPFSLTVYDQDVPLFEGHTDFNPGLQFTLSSAATPEPTTLVLVLMLLGVFWRRCRGAFTVCLSVEKI